MTLLAATAAHSEEWLYTVRPGDTLLGVSADYLIRTDYWPRLQALNGVADPTRLPPGMKLRIPIPWLKRLPAKARIVSAQGQVNAVIAATGQAVPVQSGLSLQTGDTLLTGPDSAASLEFRDGSRVLLQADSELRMDGLSAYGPTRFADTRIRLQQGRAESQVTPRTGSGPRYEISTPAAASAVRGTRYRIGMDPATATARTEVLEGTVAFQGHRTTRTVEQGFGTLAETGQAPVPPVPLLPPPKLGERSPMVMRWPVQLNFFPLDGAVAYRAQVVPADPFKALLLDTLLPALKSDEREAAEALTLMLKPVGPDLPDGDYIARIRGIDDKGLEGRDAQYRFRFQSSPGQDPEEDENRYIYK
ncbi:MAG: FecR domain-containing protein [Candidatus Contendobacter sp.]|nr:FecR domain-containing protein [Candidatus Contendobacter sp.]